jgi:hypothetical protein
MDFWSCDVYLIHSFPSYLRELHSFHQLRVVSFEVHKSVKPLRSNRCSFCWSPPARANPLGFPQVWRPFKHGKQALIDLSPHTRIGLRWPSLAVMPSLLRVKSLASLTLTPS